MLIILPKLTPQTSSIGPVSVSCGGSLRDLKTPILQVTIREIRYILQWAVRDLNPRPFDYQSNAPPS
jgi:hypothetical protein